MLFDRQAWSFSLKAFAAAVAALYIGLAGNLSRPYWAMATVYIVIQPMLGPTHSKGVYRVVGTLIAGAATLVLLPNLVETPLLLSAAMAAWLAICLFVALLDRGPRGYAFMLAGYTVAFIGFPAVTAPEGIFDTVVARCEEILLGTTMAVLAAVVLFPTSFKPMLKSRVGGWLGDAARWSVQILRQRRDADAPRNRLAGDLVQFEQFIGFIRSDNPRHAAAAPAMEQLRERMLLLLPVLSSIHDRLATMRQGGRALPAELSALVETLAEWIEADAAPSAGEYASLRAHINALKPTIDRDLDHLLLASLLLRLEELVDLWQDCQVLRHSLEHDIEPPAHPHYRIRRQSLTRHVDWGMAAFSAFSAGAALMAYCVLWIGIGWQGGGMGAMMAAVAAAFFAAQDDPTPSMLSFLLWAIVASFIAGIYLFGILPAIHDFGALVLVLAPLLIGIGLLMPNPKTAAIGLPLMVNLVALLSLNHSYSADLQSFVNTAVAMVLGMAFAVVLTKVFRSVGAEWTARRLVRQGWRTLAEAAEGRGSEDRQRFAARMLDLLGLLAPRLAAAPQGSELATVDMLGEARVGLNILQLRRARFGLPVASQQAVEQILDATAAHYREQVASNRPLPSPPALRERLDTSLTRVCTVEPGKARDEALMGLIGLRYALFPHEKPVTAAAAAAQPSAG